MQSSFSGLFATLLFSLIGMAAFGYGKKNQNPRAMLIGAALLGYTYIVSDVWLTYGIGLALTALLFLG